MRRVLRSGVSVRVRAGGDPARRAPGSVRAEEPPAGASAAPAFKGDHGNGREDGHDDGDDDKRIMAMVINRYVR